MSDVHTEHCCAEHGCKYGNDNCTVASGEKKQSYPCETCDWEEEQFQKVVAGRTLISLSYTENHPDRERTFLGIFSSKEKAQEAQDEHDAWRRKSLPQLGKREHGFYHWDEVEIDQEVF